MMFAKENILCVHCSCLLYGYLFLVVQLLRVGEKTMMEELLYELELLLPSIPTERAERVKLAAYAAVLGGIVMCFVLWFVSGSSRTETQLRVLRTISDNDKQS